MYLENGMKVTVKSEDELVALFGPFDEWGDNNNVPRGFVQGMRPWMGKKVTISSCIFGDSYYIIEDNCRYMWHISVFNVVTPNGNVA